MAINRWPDRNRILTAKVETTSGSDVSPTVASNAILTEGADFQPNHEVDEPNEDTGSLDTGRPIVLRGRGSMTAAWRLKGAAAPGTTAPEQDALYRAAGLAKTATAAAVTGTATAGASGTITLTGESSTDDAYNGMVIETTGGTGSGQVRVIHDYVGSTGVAHVTPAWTTTPDNTTEYSIRANALYAPTSEALVTVSAYLYNRAAESGVNAFLWKLLGACVDLQFSFPVGGPGRVAATLQGLIGGRTNVADPGDATYANGTIVAPVFKAAQAYMDDVALKFNALTLGTGNVMAQGDDPAATEGYDHALIAMRRITGTINPQLELESSRDSYADFVAGTAKKIWINYGSTAGNRVSLLIPAAVFTGAQPTSIGGLRGESLPFKATGNDNGFYLCFH